MEKNLRFKFYLRPLRSFAFRKALICYRELRLSSGNVDRSPITLSRWDKLYRLRELAHPQRRSWKAPQRAEIRRRSLKSGSPLCRGSVQTRATLCLAPISSNLPRHRAIHVRKFYLTPTWKISPA